MSIDFLNVCKISASHLENKVGGATNLCVDRLVYVDIPQSRISTVLSTFIYWMIDF